ncbi:hypothetical protein EHM76_01190 [bacterium]|nr:MAG: hypothetical protein EHM76_01190 [bacterium]
MKDVLRSISILFIFFLLMTGCNNMVAHPTGIDPSIEFNKSITLIYPEVIDGFEGYKHIFLYLVIRTPDEVHLNEDSIFLYTIEGDDFRLIKNIMPEALGGVNVIPAGRRTNQNNRLFFNVSPDIVIDNPMVIRIYLLGKKVKGDDVKDIGAFIDVRVK